MEHRKITLRHEVITPQAAQAILTNELYDLQRPLDQTVIQEYALAMRNGEFRQGTLVSFCVLTKKRWLINGQHTLQAIVRCGIPLELAIEEIEVATLDERAMWYGRYDRLRLRSLKNIYEAYAIHNTLDFNKSQAEILGGCLPLLASGFTRIGRHGSGLRMYTNNPQIRMAFMREWQDEANRYFACLKGAPGVVGMNARRVAVMAVALVTIRYAGTDAETFWQNVCHDDGLVQGDPCKALHVFLLTTKTSDYEPHVYSRYVARAWDHSMDERLLKALVPQAEHLPISLVGTPHTGAAILRYITPHGQVLHDPVVYDQETWQRELFAPQEAAAG